MKTKIKEYQKAVISSYLLLVLAVMPLYMRDGMNRIGDAKYIFYRNVSLLVLFLCAAGGLALFVVWYGESSAPLSVRLRDVLILAWKRKTHTEIFAVCFILASCLSYLFSDYKYMAFWGYPDWHMGLVTQLFLIGGYFAAAKYYQGEQYLWNCTVISSFAVCLVGVLNRMGRDPLYVYADISWWDWNRINLLSTIGNINWYCSYLAVVLPILLYCFWAGKGIWRIPAGISAFVGLAAMMLQGSASGYAALAAMLAVLFFGSLREIHKLLRFLEVVMMIPLFWFICWLFDIPLILLFDINLGTNNKWLLHIPLCGVVFGAVFVFYLLLGILCKRGGADFLKSGKILRGMQILIGIFIIAAVLIFLGCQVSDTFWELLGCPGILRFNDEWGNMRGALWKAAWKGFWECGPMRMLFGVGPDCFACYFYERYPMNIQVTGQWENAVYANAHNEWLNMLNNEGVLGAAAYMGFFVSAFRSFRMRYKENPKMMAGMMAIASYCVNNFFSFGQVVSTPLIFVVIGMCESERRREAM